MNIVDTKLLGVSRPYISSQSKGSLIFVQVGYTLVHIGWPTLIRNRALVELHLFGPRHNPVTGYARTRFFFRVGDFRIGSHA